MSDTVGDARAAGIASGSSRPRRAEAVAWGAALCFAFFPVLADLGRHQLETSWARYAAVFPLLVLRCVWHERDRRPAPSRDAPLWVVAGLAILLAGIAMGAIRWGRLGAALAVIGWIRRFGLASWRTQLLVAFAVPLPAAAMKLGQPLSHQLGLLSSALGATLGLDVAPVLQARFGSGLALAVLLAGLSWYASLLRARPARAALLRAAGIGLLGFPLQVLANLCAAAVAPGLGVPAARALLVQAPWALVTLAGVAVAERGARREPAR